MPLTATTQNPVPTTPDQTASTYRAAFSFQNPSGVSFEITGSGSTTIKVTKLFLTTSYTVTATVNVTSTASSGGTSSSLSVVPLDSSNSAATATVRTYSAAPTSGTVVGAVAIMPNSVTPFTLDFGEDNDKQPLLLAGAAETLVIDMSAASTGVTELLVGYVEWIEE